MAHWCASFPAAGGPLIVSAPVLLMGIALAGARAECASAEREGRFHDMAAACVDCADGPGADAFCEGRLDWLDQRADPDGGFASLQLLADARRGRVSAEAVAALLDEQRASAWVRVEASLWLARAQPDTAVDRLRGARDFAPQALVRQVELALAEALARAGQLDEAEQVEAPHRLGPSRPSPVEQVQTQRTQRWLAGVAAAVVGLFAGVTLPSIGRSEHPWGLVPLAVLVGGSAVYVSLYAEGAGAGLWLFFPGAVLMHAASARALTARPSAARRVLAAVATLAWGYLSLWWVDGLIQVGL